MNSITSKLIRLLQPAATVENVSSNGCHLFRSLGGLFCNYSMLAPYSIVFTAHSSLQKRAVHTKKNVCIVTMITLHLVHTKNVAVWELHHN